MSGLPSLGPRGEGWVAIQGVLLVAEAAAGVAALAGVAGGSGGVAWDGAARLAAIVVGLVLIALGGLLALRGVLDLEDALTALPHPRDGASLVDTGAYRLVRHPIYGGIVVGALGWGLATASPLAIAGAPVLLGFFTLKSGREEAWLQARYPGYAAYRARTRRMLPLIY